MSANAGNVVPGAAAKQPTMADCLVFYSIIKHNRAKLDVDWDMVATDCGFKNKDTAKTRYGQIRRKLGFSGPPLPGAAAPSGGATAGPSGAAAARPARTGRKRSRATATKDPNKRIKTETGFVPARPAPGPSSDDDDEPKIKTEFEDDDESSAKVNLAMDVELPPPGPSALPSHRRIHNLPAPTVGRSIASAPGPIPGLINGRELLGTGSYSAPPMMPILLRAPTSRAVQQRQSSPQVVVDENVRPVNLARDQNARNGNGNVEGQTQTDTWAQTETMTRARSSVQTFGHYLMRARSQRRSPTETHTRPEGQNQGQTGNDQQDAHITMHDDEAEPPAFFEEAEFSGRGRYWN